MRTFPRFHLEWKLLLEVLDDAVDVLPEGGGVVLGDGGRLLLGSEQHLGARINGLKIIAVKVKHSIGVARPISTNKYSSICL